MSERAPALGQTDPAARDAFSFIRPSEPHLEDQRNDAVNNPSYEEGTRERNACKPVHHRSPLRTSGGRLHFWR